MPIVRSLRDHLPCGGLWSHGDSSTIPKPRWCKVVQRATEHNICWRRPMSCTFQLMIENNLRQHFQYTLHLILFAQYLQFIVLDPHQCNLVHKERKSRMWRTEMCGSSNFEYASGRLFYNHITVIS